MSGSRYRFALQAVIARIRRSAGACVAGAGGGRRRWAAARAGAARRHRSRRQSSASSRNSVGGSRETADALDRARRARHAPTRTRSRPRRATPRPRASLFQALSAELHARAGRQRRHSPSTTRAATRSPGPGASPMCRATGSTGRAASSSRSIRSGRGSCASSRSPIPPVPPGRGSPRSSPSSSSSSAPTSRRRRPTPSACRPRWSTSTFARRRASRRRSRRSRSRSASADGQLLAEAEVSPADLAAARATWRGVDPRGGVRRARLTLLLCAAPIARGAAPRRGAPGAFAAATGALVALSCIGARAAAARRSLPVVGHVARRSGRTAARCAAARGAGVARARHHRAAARVASARAAARERAARRCGDGRRPSRCRRGGRRRLLWAYERVLGGIAAQASQDLAAVLAAPVRSRAARHGGRPGAAPRGGDLGRGAASCGCRRCSGERPRRQRRRSVRSPLRSAPASRCWLLAAAHR